jgi:methylenetetrahydrofolate dehydrogenase (NADP+) / methenyltetrahydrofolate cyclohydrolase
VKKSHSDPTQRSGSAHILDGSSVARRIVAGISAEAAALAGAGRIPALRVILVGENSASVSYVASKTTAARDAGIVGETVPLTASTSMTQLLVEVDRGNQDEAVDGLLVQMPLPPGLDPRRVFDALDPWKDVDGFHPENVGLLHQGRPRFVPCTPAGIMALVEAYEIPLAGRRAVVIGRSEIVGKPMAALLMQRDVTVTVAHSKSPYLPALCREADLLVVAIGRPGFVTREFVREGAVVVDVGINRATSLEELPKNLRGSSRLASTLAEKGRVLVGDVDFDEVAKVADWITPVPGGVGPLTVAMLLKNTVHAARLRRSRLR